MKCQQCGMETFIDHIEKSQDGLTETYIYVCVNPQCSQYRKAQTLQGKPAECLIQPGQSQ